MRYNSSNYDPNINGEFQPVPPGDYYFVVEDAKAAISKNRNEMIELTLGVDVGREKPITVFDRLVSTQESLWKVRIFCECCGLDFSHDEILPENCIGREGKAHFVLGEPNQTGRRYLEVDKYLPSEEPSPGSSGGRQAVTAAEQQTLEKTEQEDDLPF